MNNYVRSTVLIPALRRRGLPKNMIAIVEETEKDLIKQRRLPSPPDPEGGISIRAAERKYRIASATISRWVKKTFVPVLLETANEKFIDEAKLIKLVEAYRQCPGRGTWAVKKACEKSS